MIQIIERENLELSEIEKEYRENFRPIDEKDHRLSFFESFYLKVTGDVIRPKDSEHFWSDQTYCWYVYEKDEKGNRIGSHLFGVWLTENRLCMYEDFDAEKLYQVMF